MAAMLTGSGLSNVVAIANGKGGVGKTSITANVGGTAALSGWKTLLVDLDPQANLAADLGYGDRSDDGKALFHAVVTGQPVEVLAGVRERLDVVCGGEALDELVAILTTRQQRDMSEALTALGRALATVAGHYQLVMLDCPPAGGVLLEAALSAARFLIIPTKRDSGSLDGLARVARRFEAVRGSTNASLELLGVALFDFGVGDRRMLADARAEVERDLAGAAPVFNTFIRHSRRAPGDMRQAGLLAYEYENAAARARPWYEDRQGQRFSSSAGGLAEDYQGLTEEILAAVAARSAS